MPVRINLCSGSENFRYLFRSTVQNALHQSENCICCTAAVTLQLDTPLSGVNTQWSLLLLLQLPWPPFVPPHSWVERNSHFANLILSDMSYWFCLLSFSLIHIICSGLMMNYRKQLFAAALLFSMILYSARNAFMNTLFFDGKQLWNNNAAANNCFW